RNHRDVERLCAIQQDAPIVQDIIETLLIPFVVQDRREQSVIFVAIWRGKCFFSVRKIFDHFVTDLPPICSTLLLGTALSEILLLGRDRQTKELRIKLNVHGKLIQLRSLVITKKTMPTMIVQQSRKRPS